MGGTVYERERLTLFVEVYRLIHAQADLKTSRRGYR